MDKDSGLKWSIDIGHNCPPDTGAIKIKREDDLTKEIGELLITKLEAKGVTIVRCLPSKSSSVKESLQCRCKIANDSKSDLYISIHFNAFNWNANGVEVFAISPYGKNVARNVVDEIAKLGYKNRGVKDGSHLYVIKNTSMPAILIECCFCDSKTDMLLYDAEKLSDAIVLGLFKSIKQA
jgi:N-acetylmuramoyl-L-alanine amidase